MTDSLPTRTTLRPTLLFIPALIVLYAAIIAAKFALWRANVLMNDWAFFNNSLWNTDFHHYWLFSHDRFTQFGYQSYLNEHFAPLLLVIAALYHVVPRPEAMLLLLHGASPVLAAVFIYATAQHLMRDRRLSASIALSYAFNPGILWPTISLVYGFQPDSLLPPLAAAVGWALAAHRVGVYFVAFALALCVKENVPAYGFILGVCLFVFTQRRKQALITILASLVVFVVAWKGVSAITGVQNRNVGVAWRFINDLIHLRPHFDYTRGEIIIGLAYSAAFLPALFVWPFMVVIGPDLMLIGQVSYAKLVTWHVMLPVTVLGVGAVFGTARILETKIWPAWLDRRMPRPRQMRLYWTVVLIFSLVAGPATIWTSYRRYIALRSPVDRAAVSQARALISPGAGVAVTSDLEQYFVRRRVVSSRPDVLGEAAADFTYAVVNRDSLTPARRDGPMAAVYRRDECLIRTAERVARSGGRVMDAGGILVVKFARMPRLKCE